MLYVQRRRSALTGEPRSARSGSGPKLGMTLIDTAEMHAEDETERLVGDAISGRK